ncbi:major facilitator transporter [Enterobacter cloacae]|uniref:Major facilitator transporter n=1 Tax=Enterobacter cloacae TaxID=550 RepID=A0A377M1E3_ENTCL|nr:major facilitator transporter [Enterobacter cloacae]
MGISSRPLNRRGIAWYWGIGGIFLLMTCTTLLTLCSLLAIRNKDIDNEAARGPERVRTSAGAGFCRY